MDNLTHTLVGMAAAKAGLERVSPYATLMCVVATNAPDADIVTSFAGHWTYLEHHRGISHSIWGVAVLGLALPLIFCAFDFLFARLLKRERRAKFRGLLAASALLIFSHPLLDWTNSYGVRPLLPFNARWIYGDLVYVVDPFLWLLLGGALFLVTARTRIRALAWFALALLLTLAILVIPAHNNLPFPRASQIFWLAGVGGFITIYVLLWRRLRDDEILERRIASASLALIVVYWIALSLVHHRALAWTKEAGSEIETARNEKIEKLAAMPTLANPLGWRLVIVTDKATYVFDVKLNENSSSDFPTSANRYEKPTGDQLRFASEAATDERAHIFLNFARFPVTHVEANCPLASFVRFGDARFNSPNEQRAGGFSVTVPVSCPR